MIEFMSARFEPLTRCKRNSPVDGKRSISRDEMHTILVEATSVVNNTPLYIVQSSDGSVVSFQKTAVAVLASVVVFF